MKIDVITIFPDMIRGALGYSIILRALESRLLEIDVHDLRDYTSDKRRTVDDTPFGGGAGMVMKPEPVFDAVEAIEDWRDAQIILMTPQGRPFTQEIAKELSSKKRLVLVCGHYEGFDERIRQHLATDEISIGDYVLTGGELPALVVIDAVSRLLPGVLGNEDSAGDESFESDLLEYPQFTRPALYREWATPEVLLSGHHAKISSWRLAQREERTRQRRPDLWARYSAIKMQKEAEIALSKRAARHRRSLESGIGEKDRDLPTPNSSDAVAKGRDDTTQENS